jgi:hypothetical protein
MTPEEIRETDWYKDQAKTMEKPGLRVIRGEDGEPDEYIVFDYACLEGESIVCPKFDTFEEFEEWLKNLS